MKKRLSAVLAAILVCLLLLPAAVRTAYASDYDEIVSYDITAQPNVEDGSLNFTVSLDWKALEELPYGQELKIGVPNGSIREVKALTDNIEKLAFDNSYMYVYLTQKYKQGETFRFSYSWIQEYMYTLGSSGSVTYDYTPGWFDDIKVDRMTVTWLDPAGVSGGATWSADDQARWSAAGSTLTGTNLPYGSQVHVSAVYPSWPVELSWEGSSENLPDDDWGGGGGYEPDNSGGEVFAFMLLVFIVVVVLVIIVAAASRRDGYAGGFGTHYVFYNNLWYPAGPNGKPKPGSVGTAHKPKPSASSHHSSGFGGGSHGGGFGGSGFGGGSHCACASSCACACACACAGGGRAGCSAKNLYGAVRLDEGLSRKLETETE